MTPEQEILYKNATQNLLKKVSQIGLSHNANTRAHNLVLLFRESFKIPTIKYAAFSDNINPDVFRYDSDGFCRVASTAFAQLMNTTKRDWRVMYINDLWTYGPHHYLIHKPSNIILDLTYDQYTNMGVTEIPYHIGYEIKTKGNDKSVARFIDMIQKKQKD